MKFHFLTSAIAALAAGSSSAAISVQLTPESTPDLPGFTTYTVTVTSNVVDDQNNVIPATSFEGIFDGPMNQVNPQNVATVFSDFNGFFAVDPKQDSQFLVVSSTILIGTQIESANNLAAAFTFEGTVEFPNPFDLAQIVVADGDVVNYEVIAAIDGVELRQFGIIPEPASLALLTAGALCVLRRRPKG